MKNTLPRPRFFLGVACALLLLHSPALRADTIAEFTAGTAPLNAPNTAPLYIGQSFTTTNTMPVNNVAFNFFEFNGLNTTPFALGTGYLFTAPLGLLATPASLGSQPGLLGSAMASGGFYTFAPSLTLQPSTQYFFYADALFPANSISVGLVALGQVYAGGDLYASPENNLPFVRDIAQDANFRVTATVVPEPSTYATLVAGSMLLLGLRRWVGRKG
ncbi:hypothetical protein BH20VER1_BH20VER1_21700 [soil metagenome]